MINVWLINTAAEISQRQEKSIKLIEFIESFPLER